MSLEELLSKLIAIENDLVVRGLDVNTVEVVDDYARTINSLDLIDDILQISNVEL